jgi:autotransporter family porin
VLTEGDGSAAAIARTGGTVTLVDSRLQTVGRSSHGVIAGGAGQIALNNTHVRTEGEGAWAAVINDNGRMRIDGGSLVSVQHGGVWVRSSRDPGLTLSNGAVVSGGNGIALALDAAVAGRFDVVLEGARRWWVTSSSLRKTRTLDCRHSRTCMCGWRMDRCGRVRRIWCRRWRSRVAASGR